MSGGLDSTAVAVLYRPDRMLFINYGQRPMAGERRAARAVAAATQTPLDEIELDLSSFGTGLLAGKLPQRRSAECRVVSI